MAEKKLRERKDIEQKYKWDIEDMFPDESVIDGILEETEKEAAAFVSFRGKETGSGRGLRKSSYTPE